MINELKNIPYKKIVSYKLNGEEKLMLSEIDFENDLELRKTVNYFDEENNLIEKEVFEYNYMNGKIHQTHSIIYDSKNKIIGKRVKEYVYDQNMETLLLNFPFGDEIIKQLLGMKTWTLKKTFHNEILESQIYSFEDETVKGSFNAELAIFYSNDRVTENIMKDYESAILEISTEKRNTNNKPTEVVFESIYVTPDYATEGKKNVSSSKVGVLIQYNQQNKIINEKSCYYTNGIENNTEEVFWEYETEHIMERKSESRNSETKEIYSSTYQKMFTNEQGNIIKQECLSSDEYSSQKYDLIFEYNEQGNPVLDEEKYYNENGSINKHIQTHYLY